MNLTVNLSDFKKAISLVTKTVGSGTLEILKMLYLVTDKENSTLTMNSTDAIIGQSITIEAEIEEDGEVLVPAEFFRKAIGKLDAKEIKMKLEDTLKINAGRSKFSIPISTNIEEFPNLIDSINNKFLSIESNVLVNMLNRTLSTVNPSTSKIQLGGVFLEYDGEILKGTGTDAKSLTHIKYEIAGEAFDSSCIIPYNSVRDLIRLILAYSPESVNIGANENLFYLTFDGVYFISRVIEGDYPNYNNIIQINSEVELYLDKDAFQSTLDRATIIKTDNTSLIIFKYENGALKAYNRTSSNGAFEEEIEVLEGSDEFDYEIALDPSPLLKTINTMPDDLSRVIIKLSGDLRPVMLNYEDGIFNQDDFILMPIRI